MTEAGRRRLRRPAAIAAVGAVVVLAGAGWWRADDDVERVNAACDVYLDHRDGLRVLVSETDEALERAVADDAPTLDPGYYNLPDDVFVEPDRWRTIAPGLRDSLDDGEGASDLERGAEFSFDALVEGVESLRERIDSSTLVDIEDYLPEIRFRLQMVDDTCLAAARA